MFVYIFIKLAIFIILLLSSTVMFFLHWMLNTLRYERIFCESDESNASKHDPSMIFLGVHSESIFPFMEFSFFSQENCVPFGFHVSCLLLSQSA